MPLGLFGQMMEPIRLRWTRQFVNRDVLEVDIALSMCMRRCGVTAARRVPSHILSLVLPGVGHECDSDSESGAIAPRS